MLDSISPYALLQASKPRQPAVVTTAYDLFSAAQSAPPSARAVPGERCREEQPIAPSGESTPAMSGPHAAMPLVPRARTHYISDIKRRHSEALRRAYPPPP